MRGQRRPLATITPFSVLRVPVCVLRTSVLRQLRTLHSLAAIQQSKCVPASEIMCVCCVYTLCTFCVHCVYAVRA